ncbi:MAG: DUF4266 domain-containing protein [Chakrabartia sp.]
MKFGKILAGTILLACTLSGCATVQPWQRDITARKSMQLGRHPHLAAARDHTYFSKEASAGGRGFDGGGCGCN